MEDKKEEIKQELAGFFEGQSGHRRVAETIGVSPQTLYNIINGRNSVTFDTIMLLIKHYPESFAPVLTKILGFQAMPKNAIPIQEGDWKTRYQELDNRYSHLESKFDQLFEKYNKLVDLFMKKMEPSFNQSGSHTTAEEQFRIEQEIYGLIRYPQKKETAAPVWNITKFRNCFHNPTQSERLA